jgi:hypothetical protein
VSHRPSQRTTRLRNRLGALAAAAAISATALMAFVADSAAQAGAMGSGLPRTMTGEMITARGGTLARGTVLKSSTIFSTRVFRTDQDGFALATRNSADYPVLTTNGGVSWKIAGPALHVDAADGPAAVESVGVSGSTVDFAYGSGAIDVTSNGGTTWYQVFPEANVTAVVAGARGLAAYVQALNVQGLVTGTYQYVSIDGGRRWTLSNQIDG